MQNTFTPLESPVSLERFFLTGFTFNLETTTSFGAYSYKRLKDILRENSWQKVGLIMDKSLVDTEPAKDIIEQLYKEKISLFIYEARNTEEPDYDYLETVRVGFKEKTLDCLIGIGGGSTLDLTKGLAVLLTNPGKAIEYRGFDLLKNPGTPVIAIPTTAGTGSEITPYAVFIDKKEKRKLGINGRYVRAKFAILDPIFTLSCPPRVTLSAGMDALTHTLESYVAKDTNLISQMFAREAFRLIFNTFSKIIQNPNDINLRSKMLLGSFYAGIALMNSGAGPAGALSYPVGVRFKVPHGIASGIFLPYVVEYNVNNGFSGYAELYELIENCNQNLSVERKSKEFVRKLFELVEEIGFPKNLDGFGVSKKDVEFLTHLTIVGLKKALDENPIPFGEREIRILLNQLT